MVSLVMISERRWKKRGQLPQLEYSPQCVLTLAARGVISSFISLPSSSCCGLRMAWVAGREAVLLKCRRTAGMRLTDITGTCRRILEVSSVLRSLDALVWFGHRRTWNGVRGYRISSVGSAAEDARLRKLIWMKSVALDGALAHERTDGIMARNACVAACKDRVEVG